MSKNKSEWQKLKDLNLPIRILVVIYPGSPLFKNSEPSEIINEMSQVLEIDKQQSKHIVTELWPNRTVIVFDYRHNLYDFATAHYCEDLKTMAVHFITTGKVKFGLAEGESNNRINAEVANLHRLNGDVRPPFVGDHREGRVPSYDNLRDV